jgi:hypothetical protein
LLRQPGGWLRSSNTFKECVIAHWSSGSAPKMIGTKHITEALDSPIIGVVVEEHSIRAEGRPRGRLDCIEERMPA